MKRTTSLTDLLIILRTVMPVSILNWILILLNQDYVLFEKKYKSLNLRHNISFDVSNYLIIIQKDTFNYITRSILLEHFKNIFPKKKYFIRNPNILIVFNNMHVFQRGKPTSIE